MKLQKTIGLLYIKFTVREECVLINVFSENDNVHLSHVVSLSDNDDAITEILFFLRIVNNLANRSNAQVKFADGPESAELLKSRFSVHNCNYGILNNIVSTYNHYHIAPEFVDYRR